MNVHPLLLQAAWSVRSRDPEDHCRFGHDTTSGALDDYGALLSTVVNPQFWLDAAESTVQDLAPASGSNGPSASSTGPEPRGRFTAVEAGLALQFDAVIHLDGTHGLEPLERTARGEIAEPAETHPIGP